MTTPQFHKLVGLVLEVFILIELFRIADSYMIEALRLVDHYHFRVAQQEAKTARTKLQLAKPPRLPGEEPWWSRYYSDAVRIRHRLLFA